MKYFERLTSERKSFLERINTLIYNEFDRQSREDNTGKEKEEVLENNIKTISIDAGWGEGKSFFSKALTEKLEGNNIEVLSFNAWKSDYYNDALKSFLGEINEELKINGGINPELEEKMMKILKNSSKILGKIAVKKLGVTDEDLKTIQDVFSGVSESFFSDYMDYKDAINGFKKSLEELTETKKKVIIVDELDRCKPTFAIELLEAIKHIFDVEGLVFVFLINKDQLNESVKSMYGEINRGEGYFKKFFDLNFQLPELNIKEFSNLEYNNKNILEVSIKENPNYEKLNIVCNYIFIKVLENININKPTAREINLMYKKYQQLLMIVSKDEKRSLPFNFILSLYFIYREKGKEKEFETWCRGNIDVQAKERGAYGSSYSLDSENDFNNYLGLIKEHILNSNNPVYNILSGGCNGGKDLENCFECDKNQGCRQPGRGQVVNQPNLNVGIWYQNEYNPEINDRQEMKNIRMPISKRFLIDQKIEKFDDLLKMFEEVYSLVAVS